MLIQICNVFDGVGRFSCLGFILMLLALHIPTPKEKYIIIKLLYALTLSKDSQMCVFKITFLRPSWGDLISKSSRHHDEGKAAILMYLLIVPRSGVT